MTGRITWNDGDEYAGSAGTIGPFAFRIQRLFGQGLWMLTAELPGLGFRDARNEDRDTLKAEAERWLEEFASSLGAVFERVTSDDLTEALTEFYLEVRTPGGRIHGQVADPAEVARVLCATLGRIAAEAEKE